MAVTRVLPLQHWVKYLLWDELNTGKSKEINLQMRQRWRVTAELWFWHKHFARVNVCLCCERSKLLMRESISLPAGKHKVCLNSGKGFILNECWRQVVFAHLYHCQVQSSDELIFPTHFPSEHPSLRLQSPGRSRVFEDEEWGVSSRSVLAALLPPQLLQCSTGGTPFC